MHTNTLFTRKFLSGQIRSLRLARRATKQAMSEILHMDDRSYSDLEKGKYCPSGPSLLLFLKYAGGPAALDLIHTFYEAVQPEKPARRQALSLPELRNRIKDWLDGGNVPESLFEHPLANFDIAETRGKVINRVYYAVPRYSPVRRHLDCFVFYEENTFQKDDAGDLVLSSSRFYSQKG